MKNYKVIFSDLDNTLVSTISGSIFPSGIWDMKFRFDVLEKIKEIKPNYLLIITNQGGIESGYVDEESFRIKLNYICTSIMEYCGCECHASYCTTEDVDNEYRKPNTGMLERACIDYVGDDLNYIRSVSLMIGDASGKDDQFSGSDKETAENFGIDYIDVNEFVETL